MVNGLPKAGDGEWSRTGWEPQFGNLNDSLGVTADIGGDHQTWVEGSLDDKFFGGEQKKKHASCDNKRK